MCVIEFLFLPKVLKSVSGDDEMEALDKIFARLRVLSELGVDSFTLSECVILERRVYKISTLMCYQLLCVYSVNSHARAIPNLGLHYLLYLIVHGLFFVVGLGLIKLLITFIRNAFFYIPME